MFGGGSQKDDLKKAIEANAKKQAAIEVENKKAAEQSLKEAKKYFDEQSRKHEKRLMKFD